VWPPRGQKTAIHTDAHAAPLLDRVLASAPGRVGDMLVLLDVWSDWGSRVDGHALVGVYLGAHKVGELNAKATQLIAPVMQSAVERHAKPRASAASHVACWI
jgi:hypothetical protein